jgi:hypothetical protein
LREKGVFRTQVMPTEGRFQMGPAKNGIFAPLIYKNDHFAKTGSGQTLGKTQKKMPFFAPVH